MIFYQVSFSLSSGTADDILISADINSENRHRKINKKVLDKLNDT